jgi:putative oxidoreductase
MFGDVGLLVLRVVVGLLLAGHGAQKLFGSFGGPGMTGTAGWLASIGLRPPHFWAALAGLSEFVGGLLVLLGLGSSLGPLAILAPMLVAILKVHLPNGLWNENGGVELPLTNIAAALLLALTGPGRYSLDALFNIALPEPATFLGGLVLNCWGSARRW